MPTEAPRASSREARGARHAAFRRRYKLTIANGLGPYPVPVTTPTVSCFAVAAVLLTIMNATASFGAALVVLAVLALLPLQDERLREQWTWTAWLGGVTGAMAGIWGGLERRPVERSPGPHSSHLAAMLLPVALLGVFVARNARRQSTSDQFRLVALVVLATAGAILTIVLANVWRHPG